MCSRLFPSLVRVIIALCTLGCAALGQISVQGPRVGPGASYPGPSGSVFPDSAKPDAKKYSLSGTVLNSLTGEGLPHALVAINNQIETMTDSDGHFSFDGLAPGQYFIAAQKPGFFEATARPMRPSPMTTIQVGPSTPSVSLSLSPESVIFGRVTDSDGMPVQHLNVQCMRSIVVEGHREWQPAMSKSTDEDGAYRIAGLTPGRYLVVVGPSHRPSISAMARVAQQNAGYAVAYYPSPEDNGATGGMQISAGQKISADVQVDAQRFYSISGSFNAPAGTSVWLHMLPRSRVQADRGQSISRGDNNTFSIPMVPPGDYILQAGANVQNKQWSAYIPVHVGGDISGLQVVLQPAITIPVTSRVDRTKPADQQPTFVSSRYPMTPVQVILRPTDSERQQYGATFSQPQTPDSTFAVQNVAPGTYNVTFMPTGDYYVSSARYGSTDLLQEKLVVSDSAGSDAIDVVLRDDGARVKVAITGGGQPAQGSLLIVPDHGTPYVPMEQRFVSDGDLTLRNLRPGGYSILAFDDLKNVEYGSPNALDPFMSHAAHVELAPNQETSVSVELISNGGD